MKIGIKKRGTFGTKRTFLGAKIEKVERKEIAGKETVSVFFRGLEGMGVMTLAPKELEMITQKPKAVKEPKFPKLPKKSTKKKKLR